jgi:mRNA interferase MazF
VPFTDLSSRKRLPVVVLSADAYNDFPPEMIVVAMTSNPAPTPWTLPTLTSDLLAGRLNRPGMIRVDKIYMLAQLRVVNRFGTVSAAMMDRIRETLSQPLAPERADAP